MNPQKLFSDLCDAGVDFVVVGGLAANVHGSQRVTKDIDIAYLSESHNVRKLCAVLNRYEPRMLVLGEPIGQPVTVTAKLLKSHPMLQLETTLGRVDALSSVDGFKSYRALKNLSEPLPVGPATISILSRDGVLKAKRALKRPKDVDDIHQIEAVAEIEEANEAAR